MTRRQIHAALLVIGVLWVLLAYLDLRAEWINRSDLLFIGLVTMALGLHGMWKTDPR